MHVICVSHADLRGSLASEVVELEVAQDGEIAEEDDKGIQHYHPALDDQGIV